MFNASIIDVKEVDSIGRTALHIATQNNDLAQVHLLLSRGADINKKDDEFECTPLHEAAESNVGDSHFRVVEMLLENGADVNAKDKEGKTPLWYLVLYGSVEIVQLFLNYKVDIEILDNQGCNILFPATKYNKNVEVLQLLVDHGFNVNQSSTTNGRTPLHEVARNDKIKEKKLSMAETLLKKGADVNALDSDGQTPLFYLVQEANLETFKLFLNFNADVNVVDNDGETLLFQAVRYEKMEIVKLLIDYKFDVNHRNKLKVTPLHWACCLEYDNTKLVKYLLKNGADMSAASVKGSTPLLGALAIRDKELDVKVATKNLNFMLEHFDFSVLPLKTYNILSLKYKPREDYLWKTILKHLAKLESLDISVHPDYIDIIDDKDEFLDYYQQCEEELSQAQDDKLPDSWITYYNLLVDDRKKLKNYAGNKVLGEKFVQFYYKRFPIYGSSMEENMKKGFKRRELFDKAIDLLSNCLPIFNPTHLIITDILNCMMSKKDLSKFCE